MLIPLNGWFDVFGIVLNTAFLVAYAWLGLQVIVIAFIIAKGLLWCGGYDVQIVERRCDG